MSEGGRVVRGFLRGQVVSVETRLLAALKVLADVANDPICRNWLDANRIINEPDNKHLLESEEPANAH